MEAFLESACDSAIESDAPGISDIRQDCYLKYPFFPGEQRCIFAGDTPFSDTELTGKVRFAVGVDNERPVVLIETDTVDEWKGCWKDAVMNDGEKAPHHMLPWLSSGVTSYIKIYPVDQYVTLNKLVIYTEKWKESNFGPFESAFL